MGAKTRMLETLAARIAATPHRCYVDGFGGGGSVFFARHRRAPVEVFNDADCELVNAFSVVRDRPGDLAAAMRWDVASRAEFDRLKAQDPAELDEVARARRFLFLQFNGFAGKSSAPCFGRSAVKPGRWTAKDLLQRIDRLHRRLARVYVENQDVVALIDGYDRPDTLFFLDPPYFNLDRYYRQRFGAADHERLAARLKAVKGRFLLTVSDHPEMRRLYAWAKFEPVQTVYTAATGAAKAVGELLISN